MVSSLEKLRQKFGIHFLFSKLHKISLCYLLVLIYLTFFRLYRLYTIEWSVRDQLGANHFRIADGIASPSNGMIINVGFIKRSSIRVKVFSTLHT
jgi:hypothetical protein